MLTTSITFREIYFLTKIQIFCRGVHHVFFAKNDINQNFLGLNAN